MLDNLLKECRPAGFPDVKVVNEEPADWDVTKVARIWDSILTQNPEIAGAFFHNDDMALAAHRVMQQKGRTDIVIAGVDAMAPAVNAVLEGTMLATVRNPADGPVITKETAPGHLWLQKNFLI